MQTNRSFSRASGSNRDRRDNRKFGGKQDVRYNKNMFIRAKEVRLIDAEGENVGVVDIKKALDMARAADLDLVEVAPQADPPVCKITSWAKFKYELKQKEKQARKHKQLDMKEVRFGVNIGQGDKERQLKKTREFLDKGHNVKLTVRKKGRRIPIEHSKELLNDLLTELSEYSTIDSDPSYERGNVSIILKGVVGKPATKKKDAKTENTKDSSEKVQKD